MKPSIGKVLSLAVLCAVPCSAHAACSVKRIAEMPVTMASGFRPTIAAKIDGVEAPFIADSGAFYSVISPGIAKTAGLRLRNAPPGYGLSGVGGDTTAYITSVEQLTLGDINLKNIPFFVGGTDTGTAGVLGQNVLGFGDVEYDFPHGMIRLFRSSNCGDSALAYWVGSGQAYSMLKIMSLQDAEAHTTGTVYVNGQPLRATFDTGAGRTELTLRAAERVGVKPGGPGVVENGLETGLGSKAARAWLGPFASIKIGDEEIRNVKLAIADVDFGGSDLLIGADFFISHRVYVDNSAHRIFFSYTGGNVFDSRTRLEGQSAANAAASLTEGTEPKDAPSFSRRGTMFMAQRDYARAVTDFSRAIELAPKESRYLLQRALAYLDSGRRPLGAADLDKAVEVDPTNVLVRIERSRLREITGDRDGALADLDLAAHSAVGPVNDRLEIAWGYTSAEAYDRAITQLDIWIAAHPEDAELASALNSRCWARALSGQALGKALSDCNGALRRRPGTAAYLDSRGTARLQLGEYDGAITDFDAALKEDPKLAWSLYGRGIAKRHKGQVAEGEADLKAALEMGPEVAERARKARIQ